MNQNLRIIEAILFAAPEPVAEEILSAQMQLAELELRPLLQELREHYQERGVQLVERDRRWTFETAPDLASNLQFISEKPRRLSRAAIETLAIIAYHQPVTRAEIEAIRAVAISKGTIDVLMEAGWVKPGRRRETPGRPLTFITTPYFLEHFGLETLRDLPGLEELKAAGLLDNRAAIAVVPDGEAAEAPDESSESDDDFNDFQMDEGEEAA